ncbi:unnamed protein product, partial [Polarella glacialis]
AFASSLVAAVEEGQQRLQQGRLEQEEAQLELTRARTDLGLNEATVEKFLRLVEEYEQQQRELARRAILQPDEADKIQQVHRFAQRLEEAQEVRRELASESAEAKRTEAQADVERQAVLQRLARATEELRDAERHVELLRDVRSKELNLLGEFEHERRELLQAHAKVLVEHDRMKSELASWDLGGHRIQGQSGDYLCHRATLFLRLALFWTEGLFAQLLLRRHALVSRFVGKDSNVAELAIYDLSTAPVPVQGVAADLSHFERKCKVTSYARDLQSGATPSDVLKEALTGCHLVMVPAGVPRKPGMDRADLLKVNIGIAQEIVEACGKFCPDAIVGLIVNPVNSVVPAMAELYRRKGLDSKKIIGVTTLDVVRANKFVHEVTGAAVDQINIPVIGGHAGSTILPLFSQDAAGKTVPADKLEALDKRVQDAGTEVVTAKAGKGSATLSMAYAGARFASAVLSGLAGERRTECAYLESSVTELPFFSQRVTFGPKGVEEVHPIGPLSAHETKRLEAVKKQLKGEIEDGINALPPASKL